jgi:hypothetical protein
MIANQEETLRILELILLLTDLVRPYQEQEEAKLDFMNSKPRDVSSLNNQGFLTVVAMDSLEAQGLIKSARKSKYSSLPILQIGNLS